MAALKMQPVRMLKLSSLCTRGTNILFRLVLAPLPARTKGLVLLINSCTHTVLYYLLPIQSFMGV